MSGEYQIFISLAVIVLVAAYWLGFKLYRSQNAEFVSKYKLTDFNDDFITISRQEHAVTQLCIGSARWHGLIGTLYVSDEDFTVKLSVFSPAKLYWGFNTSGFRIPFSDINSIGLETGCHLKENTISFSKSEHLMIKDTFEIWFEKQQNIQQKQK